MPSAGLKMAKLSPITSLFLVIFLQREPALHKAVLVDVLLETTKGAALLAEEAGAEAMKVVVRQRVIAAKVVPRLQVENEKTIDGAPVETMRRPVNSSKRKVRARIVTDERVDIKMPKVKRDDEAS